MLGGTLTEIAIRQGRVDGLIGWLRELGLRHVEVSDGTIALDADVKRELIERLAARVHRASPRSAARTPTSSWRPYVWVEQIERDLAGGRLEGDRRGARVGHRRHLPRRRRGRGPGLIDEIAHAIDTEQADLRGAAARAAGLAAEALRHRVQPRQHRPRRRALAGDAAPRAALGHGRALRAGRRGLSGAAAGAGRGDCARRCTSRGPADPLARVVFAVLVLACFGAFFLTQRLKHTPTAVQHFELTPLLLALPGGHVRQEAISFKLAEADEVTVTIIDPRATPSRRSSATRRLPATNSSRCAGTAAAASRRVHG